MRLKEGILNKKQLKGNSDIEFEIQFIEELLKRVPDFIEALIVLGDLYTKKGLYQKGLDIDLRLLALRPDDPNVLYNLACSYSLLHQLDDALATLKRALALGYDHFEYLQYDYDLANLRQDSRYQELISTLINSKNTNTQQQQ